MYAHCNQHSQQPAHATDPRALLASYQFLQLDQQRMANSKQCLVILLVIFASAAMGAAAAVTSSSLEGEKVLLIPPGFLNPGDGIMKCWTSILAVEGCAKDVLAFFLTLQVQLSTECCSAIEGIGESCMLNIFANPPFNPFFPPLLNAFCKVTPAPPAE